MALVIFDFEQVYASWVEKSFKLNQHKTND